MKLTCYIVDDELHAVEMLAAYITQTEGLELTGYATNPLEGLNAVTGSDPPHITFLDVEMPELSGMEFAGLANLHTRIVFTTAYQEFALEAFEKEAFDFLLKPISYSRFRKCIQRIRRMAAQKAEKSEFFFVRSEIKGKMVKVNIPEIVYVEGAQNYVMITMDAGKIMPYLTLTEIQQYLPADQFTRVHQSFIVNNKRIKALEPTRLTLSGDITLPIGRSYKEAFLSQISEHVLQSKRKP